MIELSSLILSLRRTCIFVKSKSSLHGWFAAWLFASFFVGWLVWCVASWYVRSFLWIIHGWRNRDSSEKWTQKRCKSSKWPKQSEVMDKKVLKRSLLKRKTDLPPCSRELLTPSFIILADQRLKNTKFRNAQTSLKREVIGSQRADLILGIFYLPSCIIRNDKTHVHQRHSLDCWRLLNHAFICKSKQPNKEAS